MERLMFTFALRPGQEDEYERRHQAVWPALLHDLYEAGWRNYSSSAVTCKSTLTPSATLTPRPPSERMSTSQANRDWAQWFTEVIDRSDRRDGELFVADEVWHLDEELAPRHPEGDGPTRAVDGNGCVRLAFWKPFQS